MAPLILRLTFVVATVHLMMGTAGCNDDVGASSFTVVDTAQQDCYSATAQIECPLEGDSAFGQDAQYDGILPALVDNGDGTVSDLITGLMWQQTPGEKLSFDGASGGAAGFDLAGHDDWRLPTIKELYSLMRFDGTDPSGLEGSDTSSLMPFIDTAYFDFEYGDEADGERIIDAQYVTSDEYVGDSEAGQLVFGVNFADGRIKGYGTVDLGNQSEKLFEVMYVRGDGYGVNKFINNGDNTISDDATGLVWMELDSGAFGAGPNGSGFMNWEDALAWAETLDYAGYDDWRLPNAKELQSILDYSRSPDSTGTAAIDPLFDATGIVNEAGQADFGYYWTSTTHANLSGGENAVYVAFGRGLGYMNGQWIDIHGAGCQRSDPKTGDASEYPYGNGPQGDAIRIDNLVRLVRDGAALNGNAGEAGESVGEEGDTAGEAPPQEAIDACSGLSLGDACQVETPEGLLSGTCQLPSGEELACVPE